MLLVFIATLYVIFQIKVIKTNKLIIETDKIQGNSSIKIFQISDYHNAKVNSQIISKIKEEEPDVIVITGDIIDKRKKDYNNVYSLLKSIIGINKVVYFVSGNHEWQSGNIVSFLDNLENIGVNLLNNDMKVIEVRGNKINLCGIDCYPLYCDFNKVNYNLDSEAYTILLSHKPQITSFKEIEKVDLILSGHTHGGQVRLPFLRRFSIRKDGVSSKYDRGLFEKGSLKLYIDSGVGTTGIPIRLFVRGQISSITLTTKKA